MFVGCLQALSTVTSVRKARLKDWAEDDSCIGGVYSRSRTNPCAGVPRSAKYDATNAADLHKETRGAGTQKNKP